LAELEINEKKKKILEHEEWPEIKLVTSQKRSAKFF